MAPQLDFDDLDALSQGDVEFFARGRAPKTEEEAHAPAIARGAKCDKCPLYGCRRGPVMGEVKENAPAIFIGEAPGRAEVEQARPFVGPSGEILNEAIATGTQEQLYRTDCTITNVLLCTPPDDFTDYLRKLKREGKNSPVKCCKPRLLRDMAESASPTVVPVGKHALKVVCDIYEIPMGKGAKSLPGAPRSATIKVQHGAPILVPEKELDDGAVRPGVTIVPSLHPAFALRGDKAWLVPIRNALEKAARIATRGGKINWVEPEFLLNPSLEQAIGIIDRFRAAPGRKTIDLETDGVETWKIHVRCVGICADIDGREVVAVIPLRRMDGGNWWSSSGMERVSKALCRLMDNSPIGGQFLQFDTETSLNQKPWPLMTNRTKMWFDNAIAHHDSRDSEFPHSLGFQASQFTEAPYWKGDVDAKSIEGVSDEVLHRYCCKDVLGEHRIGKILKDRVITHGCADAFNVDSRLAPHARNMGSLGLLVNDEVRMGMYKELAVGRADKILKVRAALGKPNFNPGSPKQVAKWLYEDLGLTPVYDTKGEEWDEDDEDAAPSANEDSLLALLDRGGLSKETEAGIDAILEFRGIDKLIGTYIGMREVPAGEVAKAQAAGKKVTLRNGLWMVEQGSVSDVIEYEDWSRLGWGIRPILHPTWLVHVQVSGRWSCNPNLMAVPERAAVVCPLCLGKKILAGGLGCVRCKATGKIVINARAMVEAPPGHVMVGADMEQIELRLYTLDSGDALLWDAFKKGKDPHAWNFASMVGGRDMDAVVKLYDEMMTLGKDHQKVKHSRRIAKEFVYALTYGGDETTIFTNMFSQREADGSRSFPGLEPSMTTEWYDNWHRTHPETARWQNRRVGGWRRDGFIASLLLGRKRFFRGGEDRNAMCNFPIQCVPADTRVLTTRGYEPIGGLPERRLTGLGVWTGEKFAPFRMIRRPMAERIEVELNNGVRFACDDAHQVLVPGEKRYEWRKLVELKPGTEIAINRPQSMEFGHGFEGWESAYWLGYFIGNGYFGKRQVDFTIGDRPHLGLTKEDTQKSLVRVLPRCQMHPPKPQWRDNHVVQSIGGKHALASWAAAGAKRGSTAHTKRVPQTIWSASLERRKAFVLGYLHADGYCLRRDVVSGGESGAIYVNTPNRELLQDVLLLCSTIGMDGRIHGPYNADREGHIAYRLHLYRGLAHQALGLLDAARIKGGPVVPNFEAREAFAGLDRTKLPAGTSRGSVRTLMHRVSKGGSVSAHLLSSLGVPPQYMVMGIKSVTRTGKREPMFTLSVDDPSHRYCAESVVSKNCTAADILNTATLEIVEQIPHRGWSEFSGPCLQIHDYFGVYVPTHMGERAARIIKEAMTTEIKGMPFPATPKISTTWAKQ